MVNMLREAGETVNERHGEDGRTKILQVPKDGAGPTRVKYDGVHSDGAAQIRTLSHSGSWLEFETEAGTYSVTLNPDGTVTLVTPDTKLTVK